MKNPWRNTLAMMVFFILRSNCFAVSDLIALSGDHSDPFYDEDLDHVSSALAWTSKNYLIGFNEEFKSKYHKHPAVIQMSSKEIDDQFRTLLQKANKNKEPLFLYITNHGTESETSSLWDTGLQIPNQKSYSHRNLSKAINSEISPEKFVHILGSHCYGGGLMTAAFDRPKTCISGGISAIDVLTHQDGIGDAHGRAFFTEIKSDRSTKRFDVNGDGKTSMHEAHIAGAFSDSANYSDQVLSSTEYAKYVLGVYPYNEEKVSDVEIFRTRKNAQSTLNYVDGLPFLPVENTEAVKNDSNAHAAGFQTNKIQISPDKTLEAPLNSVEIGALPLSLKKFYEQYLELPEVKRNLAKASAREVEIKKLVAEEESVDAEWNKLQDANVDKEILERKRADLFKLRGDIRDKYSAIAIGYNGLVHVSMNLRMVAAFWKVASESQKKKFMELVECESRVLQ